MPRPVAAMVRLQLLTGMRAGEVTIMRGADLTTGGPVWEYRPSRHKNRWRGKARVIPLRPKAQEIVREFLKPDPLAYLFDPREAVSEHNRARARRTGRTPSERARLKKGLPGEARNERYDRRTYRQAVVRACDRTFPHSELSAVSPKKRTPEQKAALAAWRKAHRWSPLQLRHTAATSLRARYGLEAAQVVLGHAKADTTEIYAERDLSRARDVMAEIG